MYLLFVVYCFEERDYCLKRCVCDCYEAWEGREKMEREIEEGRERRCEVEEDRDGEENRRKMKRREEEGRRLRAKDLDIEYHRKDLCRRFIAHTGGIIDIHPPLLTLRMFEMRIPTKYQMEKGRNDPQEWTISDKTVDSLEALIYLARGV